MARFSLFDRARRGDRDQPTPLDYSGSDEVEVKGEASYQAALAAIAGPKTFDGHYAEVRARLRRDPDNQYDANAVAVLVRGRHVGFVNRDDAALLTGCVERIEAANPGCCVEVRGVIVGGWDRGDGDTGHYGIWLHTDRKRLFG